MTYTPPRLCNPNDLILRESCWKIKAIHKVNVPKIKDSSLWFALYLNIYSANFSMATVEPFSIQVVQHTMFSQVNNSSVQYWLKSRTCNFGNSVYTWKFWGLVFVWCKLSVIHYFNAGMEWNQTDWGYHRSSCLPFLKGIAQNFRFTVSPAWASSQKFATAASNIGVSTIKAKLPFELFTWRTPSSFLLNNTCWLLLNSTAFLQIFWSISRGEFYDGPNNYYFTYPSPCQIRHECL